MAKNVNLQDDEKCCIFAAKDKTQAIILTMSYIEYLQVFDSKSDLEFLILDCKIYIILKIIKDIGFMTPRRFNIYIKSLS